MCGVIVSNEGMLSKGRMMTVPASRRPSIRVMSLCIAMIDAYSVP
jgi:hypothetical protein